MDSLIKKLINKPDKTYESLGDKVGVRIVIRYVSEIDGVMSLVAELFACSGRENKLSELGPDKVGYLTPTSIYDQKTAIRSPSTLVRRSTARNSRFGPWRSICGPIWRTTLYQE